MANELKPIDSVSIDQWWADIKSKSNTLNGLAPTTEMSSGISLKTPIPPKEEPKEDYNKTLIDVTNEGNRQRMEALKAFQKSQSEGLSAYQTLLKNSFKHKEEIAKKQERNARSQAIANALGSLVNVITAGAMAKRGGYAPIVANYDNTSDNALRKSIEQRYALANENENLLMNLENERRRHEAEVARQNYAQEIASIDAETKAKTDHLNTLAKEKLYRDRTKWRIEEEVKAAKQKAEDKGEVQKGVHDYKVEKPLPSQKDKNPKKDVITTEELGIANAINDGRDVVSNNAGKISLKPHKLSPTESKAIVDEYRKSLAGGLQKKDLDAWKKINNVIWADDDMRNMYFGKDKTRNVIIESLNKGLSAEAIIENLREKAGVNNVEIKK